MDIIRPEVLAPAGDAERLKAAVYYGADAVYMGGTRFGMRAAPKNFSDDELAKAVSFAHENGVKVYLTCNIIPNTAQLKELPEFLEAASAAGVDALIITDLGVLSYAKKYAPKVPIHISTQTGVANAESARMLFDLGAERVVSARELTLDELADLRAGMPKEMELECFVHGAMCVSYSGRCLLSNYLTDRHSNKGECSQPCRWEYSLMERTRRGEYFPVEETASGTYIMNSKDMCMIEHIPELIEAGVSSFKIEGRARAAEYVYTVVKCYKEALRAVLDGTFSPERVAEWDKQLATVFNRGFWDGYYLGQKMGEWSKVYGSQATERKQYIGKGQKYFSRLGVGEFLLEAGGFQVGDKLLIVGPTTGAHYVTATDIHGDHGPVQKAEKGMRVSIPVPEKTRPSDKLYLIVSSEK